MSSITKILWESAANLSKRGGKREIAVGVFGKHPAWEDHVENLEPEILAEVAAAVDKHGLGWQSLPEDKRLPAFSHCVFWKSGRAVFAAVVASSMDNSIEYRTGKPLTICVRCGGLPSGWILETLLPRLQAFHRKIAPAVPADQVLQVDTGRYVLKDDREVHCYPLSRTTFGTTRITRKAVTDEYAVLSAELTHMVQSLPDDVFIGGLTGSDWETFFNASNWGGQPQRLGGVLETLASRLETRPAGESEKESPEKTKPVRVPAGGLTPAKSLLGWVGIGEACFGDSAPLMFSLALDEGWLDLQVAEQPGQRDFFYWRASADYLRPLFGIPEGTSGIGAKLLLKLSDRLKMPEKVKAAILSEPLVPPAIPKDAASQVPPLTPPSTADTKPELTAPPAPSAMPPSLLVIEPPGDSRKRPAGQPGGKQGVPVKMIGLTALVVIICGGLLISLRNGGKPREVAINKLVATTNLTKTQPKPRTETPATTVAAVPSNGNIALTESKPKAVPRPEAVAASATALAGDAKTIELKAKGRPGVDFVFSLKESPALGSVELSPATTQGNEASSKATYKARRDAAGKDQFRFSVAQDNRESDPVAVQVSVQASMPPRITALPAAPVILESTRATNFEFFAMDDQRPQALSVQVKTSDELRLRAQARLTDSAHGKWLLTLTPAAIQGSNRLAVTIRADDGVWQTNRVLEVVLRERPKIPPLITGLPDEVHLLPGEETNLPFTVGLLNRESSGRESMPIEIKADPQGLAQTFLSGDGEVRKLVIRAGQTDGKLMLTVAASHDGLTTKRSVTVWLDRPAEKPMGDILVIPSNRISLVWMPDFPGSDKWAGKATRGMWVGQHEITQGQYAAIMGVNPSYFGEKYPRKPGLKWSMDLPVESVTWEEARAFYDRLTAQVKSVMELQGWQFQLPSHAQSDKLFEACGVSALTNLAEIVYLPGYMDNKPVEQLPMPAGEARKQQARGLYDVFGNVEEWVWPAAGTNGVARGGGIKTPPGQFTEAGMMRADNTKIPPSGKAEWLGFRVVLAPPKTP